MQKITVVILSLTILFQSFSIEISDITKVSILVDHFLCHLETGDSLDDFMSMHYGSEVEVHKNEHKEHKELPFKKEHLESHFQNVFAFFLQDAFTSFSEISFKEHKFAYNEPTSNSFVNSFLQPPQK